MKNIKNNKINSFLAFIFTLFLLSSCSKDDNGSANTPPVIMSVAAAANADGTPSDLTPITQGYANNMYIIRGSGFKTTKKIYFNEKETFFNPTLVTDTEIFVTVDINTPYENASDELKVITESGTATYHFVIAPPAPQVKSYNSINAADGDTFTIYGDFFLNPVVTVGTTQATIISSTLTEIQAIMPANSNDKYVSVTTISGTSTYERAVGSAIFDDIIQGETSHATWSPFSWNLNFGDDKVQGLNSMKITFGSWDGLDMLFTQRPITQYKSIRMQIKGTVDNSNASIKVVFNGDNGGWSYQIIKNITTSWTTIEIPFSEVGNPTFFNKLTLQESGGFGGNTILIDNIGFVLN